MQTISKSKLKAKMLGVFRDLEQEGGELIITDHGKPVLKVTPIDEPKRPVEEVFADIRGKVKYYGDILEPETDVWPQL